MEKKMKKILIFCFSLFATTQLIAADNSSTAMGMTSYGKETMEELTINGFGELNGTKVTLKLEVNGSLQATNADIGKMQVNGKATLENCIIRQKSTIHGFLTAKNTKFFDEITIASKKTVFDSCSLTSIHILKSDMLSQEQVVLLSGSTKISGSITFDRGMGKVILEKGCEIKDVVGGQIVKQRE
jgi:hypothetical protein